MTKLFKIYLISRLTYIKNLLESFLIDTDSDENMFTLHKLSTIGLVRSFGDTASREYFFHRKEMSPEGLKKLVENFVDEMERSQKKMVELLPESIVTGWKKYGDLIRSTDFKQMTPEVKINARRKFALLKDILTLPVYSWVSQIILNYFHLNFNF